MVSQKIHVAVYVHVKRCILYVSTHDRGLFFLSAICTLCSILQRMVDDIVQVYCVLASSAFERTDGGLLFGKRQRQPGKLSGV